MTTDLATPRSIAGLPREEIVAINFLSAYREPTRTGYALGLKQWFQWCHDRGVKVLEAERRDIELWARKMEEKDGVKASTIAGKLTPVLGMYRFALRDKYITENPGEWVRKPTVPRHSTTAGMTRSELLAVLDKAQECGPREHALGCILGLNGLRIGEVLDMNVEDVARQGGYHTIKFVREKKNKEDGLIPLAPRTSWAVEQMLHGRTTGPLFLMRAPGQGEQRLDRPAARRMVKRLVKAAGITNKRITPHSFRHTFVTLALDAGVSIRDVQNSVGHSDPRMVVYYDRHKQSLPRNATHSVSAYVEGS